MVTYCCCMVTILINALVDITENTLCTCTESQRHRGGSILTHNLFYATNITLYHPIECNACFYILF